ncbi:hypothetical protein AB0J80_16790 [Actinoplanes sp. NPDC049548]|uniref:hypothetical protein n=1 Tax=Actinoplanes sp. NPDC049548 TaxID=3155152 RepID=UPI00344392DA
MPPVRAAANVPPGRATAQVSSAVAVPGRATAQVSSAVAVPGQGTARVPGQEPADVPGDEPSGRVTGAVRAAAAARVSVPSNDDDHDAPGSEGGPLGGLRGARSELRRQMRAKRRLRVLTLVSLSVLVLGLLPLIFGIRSATRDPVFNSLDALDVPAWAGKDADDRISGSRWCFFDCRFREREAQSERPFEETNQAYSAALRSAGWTVRGGQCTDQPGTGGKYTCWTRDEFTLDLWVRQPECAVDAVAAQDPATLPSAGPDGTVPTADPAKCVGSTVTIKVQNAVMDERGKPQPAVDPSLIGETPDPVLTNDPLLEPTPSAS